MHWSERREQLLDSANSLQLPPNFKLPVLSNAVTRFTRKASDPEASAAELGKILETDAGLTIEILQYVNSSLFGLRNKVTSVKHALNLLGIPKVRSFVLTSAVKRSMSRCKSRLINLDHFWSANLERALFAREVALLMKVDADTAFAAAMLQDFFLPVITSAMHEQYAEFVDQQETLPQPLHEFEQAKFGWNHASAAAQLAHRWSFPDEMVCCLFQHHEGLEVMLKPELARSTVAAVAISSLVPGPFQQVPNGLEELIKLNSIWTPFDLDQIAHEIDNHFQDLGGKQAYHISLKSRLERYREANPTTEELAPAE